jgi:hypothetical protein
VFFVLVRRLRHRTLLPLGKFSRQASVCSSVISGAGRYSPELGPQSELEMGEVEDEERRGSWTKERLL